MSGKQENSQQDLQAGRTANSLDFHYTAEKEFQDIMEGSAPSLKGKKRMHTE
jgi:hypothetical protein